MNPNSVDCCFENITLNVKCRQGTKRILRGVSGRFLSGELSAIMGPSGAGKTSLLNVLTGFQVSGTQGTIKCNSPTMAKQGVNQYKKQSCYILQDDALPAFLTVQESMMMCCNMKVANMTEKAKKFLVDGILNNLGLSKCRNTRCQNLSGGQQKRVSVALELVDNPPIMFLDEPTTGLDSSSAAQCVRMLKSLARGGRTIVCTIHQPNASLYELFDHIYVVSAGRCVYQGASTSTVEYLSTFGLYCPQYHNPADYLLEVVSGEHGDYNDILADGAKDEKWRGPPPPFRIHQMTDLQTADSVVYAPNQSCEVPSEWTRFCLLLQRNGRHLYRDYTVVHLKLFINVLVGIGIGSTYEGSGNDALKVIANIGFLLASLVYLTFTAVMPSILKFPSELKLLKKEVFNNWYDLKSYYAATMLFDIPFQIIFCIVYCTPSYFLSGQPLELTRYCMVLLMQCLTSLTSSAMGLSLGTLFNPVNGTFIGSIILALMICMGGFLIIYTHMSKAAYFFTYFSFLSFATEGVVQALYGYDRGPFECADSEDYCHFTSPPVLLEEVGMEKQNYWFDVLYVIGTCIAIRLITFFTLKRKMGSI